MVGLRSLLTDIELVLFETPGNAGVKLRWMGSAWVRLDVLERRARKSNQSKKVETDSVHRMVHIRLFRAARPSAVHDPRRVVDKSRSDGASLSVVMHRASVN